MSLLAIIYLLISLFCFAFAIYFIYKGYYFQLRIKESREKSGKYKEGSWKYYWYTKNDYIFYFIGIVFLIVGGSFLVLVF